MTAVFDVIGHLGRRSRRNADCLHGVRVLYDTNRDGLLVEIILIVFEHGYSDYSCCILTGD